MACGAVRRFGDRGEPGGDRFQRFVPADALEASFTLPADALHRVQHARVGVRALEIARDLRAQRAAGRRVVRRAADFDRATVLDRDEHRARVRAVVRTGAADDRAVAGGVEGHRSRCRGQRAIIHVSAARAKATTCVGRRPVSIAVSSPAP